MPNPTSYEIEMKAIEDNIIKDIKNLFRLKRKNNVIEDTTIRDKRTLFESVEEDYHEPVRIGNAFSNSCIEYEGKVIKIKHYQLTNILVRLDQI